MNLQLRGREQGSWELGGARRAELPAGAVMQKGSQGDWGGPAERASELSQDKWKEWVGK